MLRKNAARPLVVSPLTQYIVVMKWLVAAGMVLAATIGFAQSSADTSPGDLAERLEEASRISDPQERLQAYDGIVHDWELSSQPIVSLTTSKWVDSSSTDPLDDSRTVMLTLESETASGAGVPPASLVIRYADGRADVFINWNTDLGPSASITWRIGTEKAQTADWVASANGRATFYPGNASALVRKLLDSDSFVARLSRSDGDPILAQFDVRGLPEALSRYAQGISW